MRTTTAAGRRGTGSRRSTTSNGRPLALPVLAAFALLLLVVRLWGDRLTESGRRILLDSAPLTGHDAWRVTWRVSGAALALALVVAFGPRLARRLPWRALLATSVAATGAWALGLALVEGWSGVTAPLLTPTQYLHDVPAVDSVGEFLRTYTDRVETFHAHVRVHPPAMLIILWALDAVGLGGAEWTAALVIGAGSSAVAAVLIAVRAMADEDVARRAAPFVVLAPAAMWVASTYDAFFASVGAWGVAAVAVAVTGEAGDRRADALAGVGGVLLGVALTLSYGLVLLFVVPAAIVVAARRWRVAVVAGAAALVPVAAVALGGFDWVEAFRIARREYAESVAATRPYGFFFLSNLGAVAVAVGPAVVLGLIWLRDRRLWWVVGAALVAIAVANVSGLSKGEVERIWLPFTIWLLPAAAALSAPAARGWRAQAGPWLVLNGAFALLVQIRVHTVW